MKQDATTQVDPRYRIGCEITEVSRPAALFGQLLKSSLSVQLNIAEGYALGSHSAFAFHLRVAYGSSVETCEILELAWDKGIIPVDTAAKVLEHSCRSQKLTLGLYKRYRQDE